MQWILYVGLFVLGGLLTWIGTRFVFNAHYRNRIKEAEAESEVIKKNKMLEVKEKFLSLKADLEKQVNQRNAKIQATESKLKQREMQLNQRNDEIQRKKNELTSLRDNLDSQKEMLEKRQAELDKIHKQAVEKLEILSGLSADEAKERLVESLKEEEIGRAHV